MKTVYLGLGSNVGDRRSHLEAALAKLDAARIGVRRRSSVFETEPQGNVTKQGWFLNLVLEARTALFPMQLLAHTQRIEKELGRSRVSGAPAGGPRTIDIDILLFGHFVIDTPQLIVPHPRLAERRFVLEPLCELAPDLRHPVIRKTMRELLGAISGQQVRRLPPDATAC